MPMPLCEALENDTKLREKFFRDRDFYRRYNCYYYAIGSYFNLMPIANKWSIMLCADGQFDGESLRKGMESIGAKFISNDKRIPPTPDDGYLIAAFCSSKDFHFFRAHADGGFSHKMGWSNNYKMFDRAEIESFIWCDYKSRSCSERYYFLSWFSAPHIGLDIGVDAKMLKVKDLYEDFARKVKTMRENSPASLTTRACAGMADTAKELIDQHFNKCKDFNEIKNELKNNFIDTRTTLKTYKAAAGKYYIDLMQQSEISSMYNFLQKNRG
ncbi:MAG: hypothetical protein LBJ18_04610 [Rickettsiales bacterium]|jgi:hypothetical protein|nr:hypothetical protein [Rickettsiales bacterium]